METKNKNIKDHGLWLWSHTYKFSDGHFYHYDGTVTALSVAKWMRFPITQKIIDAINLNYDLFKKALEDDELFNEWLVGYYFDDACFRCYEEDD